MVSHQVRIVLTVSVLAAAAVAVCAAQGNQPPAQRNAKDAVQTVPAKDSGTNAVPAAPKGGVVVFKDPVTGKIRQPDASEIGALVGSTPPIAAATAFIGPVPSAEFQGPGGSVWVKLGDDSLTYMVVTKAADGKLAADCVTGGKAAAAAVAAGAKSKAPETPKSKEVPNDK